MDCFNNGSSSSNIAAAGIMHSSNQIPPSIEVRARIVNARAMDSQQPQQQQQQANEFADKSPTSDLSSSSSSTSSAPQYSDDVRRSIVPSTYDLLPRQGSGSSTKTCEIDLGEEERDTFSPVSSSSSNSNSPSDIGCGSANTNGLAGICNGSMNAPLNIDNKSYGVAALPIIKHKSNNGSSSSSAVAILNAAHSTTKAEKQRQNEEIVIMETSSISSETGSWESVFPQATTVAAAANTALTTSNSNGSNKVCDFDLRNCCNEFLQSERVEQETVCLEKPKEKDKTTQPQTGNTSFLFPADLAHDRDNPLTISNTSACFIDASSLRDEDEVLSFPSLDGQQTNDELAHNITAADDNMAIVVHKDVLNDNNSPTKQLESFHKSFAKCQFKTKPAESTTTTIEDSNSSSSSHSAAESPHKGISATSASSTNNLSDEEKLWKRGHNLHKVNAQLKEDAQQQQQQQPLLAATVTNEDATEASVSLVGDLDSSDSSEIVRREQQRKQTTACHVQAYSVHALAASPKFAVNTATAGNTAAATATLPAHNIVPHGSDLSYTTDYSSSSPAPSLVWSEHEQQRPTAAARHAHAEDYDAHAHKLCHLPDTPHNSIAHIDTVSSNSSSIHRDYTLSSSLSHQRDSGAYCSDATDSPIPMPRTPKRSKFDEANPIVSGGASIKDFNILKQCESPPVQRKTETCPIVSGGFVSLDFEHTRPLDDDDDEEQAAVEFRPRAKPRKPLAANTSWIVDMSDCRPERRKSTSSTSSMETTPAKFRERSDSTSSHKSGCGFYVSLDDMDKKPQNNDLSNKSKCAVKPEQMSKSYNTPKSAGFFVNLSKSEYQPKETLPVASNEEQQQLQISTTDKAGNIFSMFIDIGERRSSSSKKEPLSLAQRLNSSINSAAQKRAEEVMQTSASSTETLMSKSSNLKTMNENEIVESKSLDYRCNLSSDAPVTVAAIRRISQQRAQNEATKRHSWGNNSTATTADSNGLTHDYKRSISLTAAKSDNGNNCLMSIIDKIPLISKASSLSIDSSLSPYDGSGSKSELSTCSNNSAGEQDEHGAAAATTAVAARVKKHRRDVQINETFDKSSLTSITDGILSKDLSPASTTDTDDITFQQDEELAIREAAALQQVTLPALQTSNRSSAIIMETILEAKETSSPKKCAAGHTMESLHATIEKQKMLLETVNEHAEAEKSTFVKLSDMDKPVRLELQSPEAMMSKSVGNHRQSNRFYRDARPHSWAMTRSTGNSFLNITNSVDNLRSLSRLFPNFSKEFSNSLPNDMTLNQTEYLHMDISADSSLASSISRSGMDESSISCRQPRRLGEDLLKMFLQEIATDMIVEVHGRRIKAHKCILRSRCQYFAAMLAGNVAQNVVALQGYSYSSVHFALCHIYSGASHPPDGISLMELAALADLLGLEGLKEVTSHALKTNYCHNFHKPCSGCIDGILQVLPVALNHALDDLYRKCLRWTCRHYLKVWPTRQFAQLPADIFARCRQQIVAYLTSESVLDTVLDCDNLLAQLAAYRWGGICENLVRDILDAAYAYVADHFASLIASDAFLSLGHDRSCHIPRLENVLLRTASNLTPDQACRSYQRVTRLNTVLQAKIIQMPANLGELAKELQGLQEEDLDWDPEYIRLVSAILSAVEQCLIRQCSRAMRVTAWQRMDLDLRKKIQTLARLTEPLDFKRSKPVSKALSFSGSTRNHDLYQVKLAIQAHSKRALAQDTQLYKATQTQDACNVQTIERGVQANNDLRENSGKILKSNSRAHVPIAVRSAAQAQNMEARTAVVNTHRRTKSDAPVATVKELNCVNIQKSVDAAKAQFVSSTKPATKTTAIRLAEVRPRYLEPRKTRTATTASGPVRSATSSSIPAGKLKGHHISSSDSSRNSSPAARKGTCNVVKIGNKSTNMSLDSLSSPSRRSRNLRGIKLCSDNEHFSDICNDSLADSMKSSVITNKTISQESLQSAAAAAANAAHLSRSNPLLGINNKSNANNLASRQTQSSNISNGNFKAAKPAAATAGNKASIRVQQQHITSTGSSPSSVTTTKSATSRLSSVSSTHSVPRDLFKNRSISVPGQDISSTPRRSFLSAKSREILAKRAEKNKQLQEQQQPSTTAAVAAAEEKPQMRSTGPMRSASHSAVTTMLATNNANRSSLPSNIPTRRPNTLQLRKTNGYNDNSNGNGNKPTVLSNAFNNNNKVVTATNGIIKTAQAVKQKIELLIESSSDCSQQLPKKAATTATASINNDSTREGSVDSRLESKLERSSTFCKESSELDISELQIIE